MKTRMFHILSIAIVAAAMSCRLRLHEELWHNPSADGNVLELSNWLQKGAEIDGVDENGDTAIVYSASHEKLDATLFLMCMGAKTTTTSKDGATVSIEARLRHGYGETFFEDLRVRFQRQTSTTIISDRSFTVAPTSVDLGSGLETTDTRAEPQKIHSVTLLKTGALLLVTGSVPIRGTWLDQGESVALRAPSSLGLSLNAVLLDNEQTIVLFQRIGQSVRKIVGKRVSSPVATGSSQE